MSDYSNESTFSDQMDSTQNLSSPAESGSHYRMESGLYITSFAAAIFIAAIVTIGVLFITLVTALTVMLQSCQTSCAGLVQLREISDPHHYSNYCRAFALQAELNSLELHDFPSICNTRAIRYIQQAHYLRDLNWTIGMVDTYFNTLKPQADGMDVVLIDVDDVLTSTHPYQASALQYRFGLNEEKNQVQRKKLQAGVHILELHSKLLASGWSLIYITRKPEKLQNATIETLISSGYGSWSSLIMRSDDEMLMESWEYFSRRRAELQNLGFRIISVISSRMDALTGPHLGKHVFKLPSPTTYEVENHVKSF